jgi:hypothetical protein
MKASPKILLNEISKDLNQFLKNGNFSSFSKEIDPNLNIVDLNKLLRIHFVLTKGDNENNKVGVIDFIENLSQRLRRIKTTVTKETELLEGEVRGRINWMNTISERCKRNPKERTLLVCEKREKDYNIAENLVLKRLLKIIHNIIYFDLMVAFENKYIWLEEWTDDERKLKDTLNTLFLKNVYLKRIDLKTAIITDRMISRAKSSRNALYRDSANLLERYNKLMAYDLDPSESKELLNNTFIKPEKTEVLFELYWTIKIINQFKNPSFHIIEPGSNIVADWEIDGNKYRIYHNSSGSFEFKEKVHELMAKLTDQDNYFGRELKVIEKLEEIAEIKPDSLWGGRPDILLEKFDDQNNLVSIFIGEVKYTQNKEYAYQGLKELLEYMALIKKKGEYVEKFQSLFNKSSNIKGCLFLDYIDNFQLNLSEDSPINVLKFGENVDSIKELIS